MFDLLLTYPLLFVAGYVVAVLIPVPGISRWILDKWRALYMWTKSKFSFAK